MFCAVVGVAIAYGMIELNIYSEVPTIELQAVSRTLGGTIAQIAMTLAGFILTSMAIFAAFGDKPLVKNMYKSGHASNLIVHMYIAIFFSVLVSIAGIWVLIMPAPGQMASSLLVGLSVSCLTAIFGVMRKLWYVLHFVHGDPSSKIEYENIDQSVKEVPPRMN